MLRRLLLAAVVALAPSFAAAQFATIGNTPPTSDNGDRLATTAWINNFVNAGLPLASGKIWIGSVGNIATAQTPSGDLAVSNAGVFTFGTVNANVGSFGSATQCASVTVNAKGLVTAASQNVCTPAIASVTGLGTGVAAALAINVGSAGAPVLFNGAGGAPSSMVGTNITGTAAGLTAGTVTTNANLTGNVTSVGNVTTLAAGSASNLNSGTLLAARMPALTGDCATTAGTVATICTKINGVDQTAAWTSYTPTVSATSGTFTTVSATGRYRQIGKTIILQADVTMTAIGTAITNLQISLPFTAASNVYVGIAREHALTGKSGAAIIQSGGSIAIAIDATGASFIANGNVVAYGITYEIP